MEQLIGCSPLQYKIENLVSNGLGYNPKFRNVQGNGEVTEVDLVRHLGEMDQIVICRGATQELLQLSEGCDRITIRYQDIASVSENNNKMLQEITEKVKGILLIR